LWVRVLDQVAENNDKYNIGCHYQFVVKLVIKMSLGICMVYVGISKMSETGSIEHQPMIVRECVRCGWEQGTSPLSMPCDVAV
jgi:hypothetical protein